MTKIRSKAELSVVGDISFVEDTHTYTAKYTRLPSVTQVMKPITNEMYKNINYLVMRKAARRGTAIHKMVEDYDNGDLAGVEVEYPLYLMAYQQWCKDTGQVPIVNEFMLYHKDLLYAGTLDKIVIIDGETVLVDLKTTAALHCDTTAVQVSAYKHELESWGLSVDKIAVLQLKDNGTYEYVILEDKFDMFLALYKIYGFNQKGRN